jgi:hypothetical protein
MGGWSADSKTKKLLKGSLEIDFGLRRAQAEATLEEKRVRNFDRDALAIDTARILDGMPYDGFEFGVLDVPDYDAAQRKARAYSQASKMVLGELKAALYGDAKFDAKIDKFNVAVVNPPTDLDLTIRQAAIVEAGNVEGRQLLKQLILGQAYWSSISFTDGDKKILAADLDSFTSSHVPTLGRITTQRRTEHDITQSELDAAKQAKRDKRSRESAASARYRRGTHESQVKRPEQLDAGDAGTEE